MEKGQEAIFRGERVSVLQKADPNGLRYIIRYRGEPIAVRGAELTPAAESEEGNNVESAKAPVPAPKPPPQNAIPPAFVGLKKKAAEFKANDWDGFCEILTLAIQLQVVDLNVMSNEMGVSVSNLMNWSRRNLRPPVHMMREAVRNIDQNIGSAIAEYQDRARAQAPEAPPASEAARSVRTTETPASIRIMEVEGTTYTIEIRQNGDIIEAKCTELPHLATRADNQVDMMIDMKRLLVEKPHVPQGEGYAGDRGLKENPPEPAPATPEPQVREDLVEDLTFPEVPPADAGLAHDVVEPEAPFEKRPGVVTKYAKKLEPAEFQKMSDEPKPEKKAPDVSDSIGLLSKIKEITET